MSRLFRAEGRTGVSADQYHPEISRSKRNRLIEKIPAIGAILFGYQELLTAVTGRNGVKHDFKNLFNLYSTATMEHNLEYRTPGYTEKDIKARLHGKLGSFYRLGKKLHLHQ